MKAALKARFSFQETVQSLSSELHNRVQHDGESLADFSSALLCLHERMEAAASVDEKSALIKLRDNTLKERFIRGVHDRQVQRELRRSAVAHASHSFLIMRREVLRVISG